MSEPALDDDLTRVELDESRRRYQRVREQLLDLQTGVVIRCHELSWATDGSNASILRQVDEVVRRWHEAEEQAQLSRGLLERVGMLEAEVFMGRNRNDTLTSEVAKLRGEVTELRAQRGQPGPYSPGGGGVPSVF